MLPVPIGRILINPSPGRIEQIELGSERFSRHPLKGLVSALRLSQAILDGVPVEELLARTPAAVLVVITISQSLPEDALSTGSKRGLATRDQRRLWNHRRAGRRIINDRLQHRSHLLRRQIPSPLHDFASVAVKDDRRRPTVIFVSIRKI